jgi:alpha-1,2-mannosyltransferase
MPAAQKNLLVALAFLLILQTLFNLAQYTREVQGGRFGGDFVVFWQVAQETVYKDISAIYGKDKITGESIVQLAQVAKNTRTAAPFAYPPHFLLFIWPLAYLSYDQAVTLWSLLQIIIFYVLLFKLYGFGRHDWQLRLIMAASVLPMLSANLFSGQTGTWLAILFMLVVHYWPRAIPAGICLGLMTIKPQLGLLWPVALIASRRWRTIAIAVLTAGILCAIATVWLGTAIWTQYFQAAHYFGQYMSQGFSWFAQLALSPFISLYTVGIPKPLAMLAQGAVSVVAIILVITSFRRSQPWSFPLLACTALLVTPYALAYDSPLLAVAIMPLLIVAWGRGWRDGWELAALVMVLVMPYAQPLLMRYHLPFGLIALLCFSVIVYRRSQGEKL